MQALILPIDDHHTAVWLAYVNAAGRETTRPLITTDNDHADRIVHAINAPKQASFPAVLAAVGARRAVS